MGWLGLSILSTIIILGVVHYNERKPFRDWFSTAEYQIGAIMGFILSMLGWAIIGLLFTVDEGRLGRNADTSHCTESVYSRDIVTAVRDKSSSSSFILGTGGSRTIDRYYVYRQEQRGLMFTTYDARKTYVVEQGGQPRYDRIDYICPQPRYDFFWWSSNNTRHNEGRYGTLYVPEDTILREFKF